jgi:hypothetical protein
MLQGINLVLWMAVCGAIWMPIGKNDARWIATAGFVFAALWQHAHLRGLWRKREHP